MARPNSDVVRRRIGGQDVTGRRAEGWVIDFIQMPENEAALYELPFEYVRQHVRPIRANAHRKHTREKWWIHGEARPGLRRAIASLSRCIVTPEVAKHRIFVWMSTDIVPDHKLHVIARDDDVLLRCLALARPRALVISDSVPGRVLEDDPRYYSNTYF